ncbi:unnamed protein product [Hymenolepis diminuta]|uniref:SAM domain-containing protein n=1 Tax=Hymenolepis diminuta TaxID=6216 RepID=A0A564YW12_HYMDI|nr:unnamed protein product [Hymenolepis diminuta]
MYKKRPLPRSIRRRNFREHLRRKTLRKLKKPVPAKKKDAGVQTDLSCLQQGSLLLTLVNELTKVLKKKKMIGSNKNQTIDISVKPDDPLGTSFQYHLRINDTSASQRQLLQSETSENTKKKEVSISENNQIVVTAVKLHDPPETSVQCNLSICDASTPRQKESRGKPSQNEVNEELGNKGEFSSENIQMIRRQSSPNTAFQNYLKIEDVSIAKQLESLNQPSESRIAEISEKREESRSGKNQTLHDFPDANCQRSLRIKDVSAPKGEDLQVQSSASELVEDLKKTELAGTVEVSEEQRETSKGNSEVGNCTSVKSNATDSKDEKLEGFTLEEKRLLTPKKISNRERQEAISTTLRNRSYRDSTFSSRNRRVDRILEPSTPRRNISYPRTPIPINLPTPSYMAPTIASAGKMNTSFSRNNNVGITSRQFTRNKHFVHDTVLNKPRRSLSLNDISVLQANLESNDQIDSGYSTAKENGLYIKMSRLIPRLNDITMEQFISWDPSEVEDFLNTITEEPELVDILRRNEVNGDLLLNLTEETVKAKPFNLDNDKIDILNRIISAIRVWLSN